MYRKIAIVAALFWLGCRQENAPHPKPDVAASSSPVPSSAPSADAQRSKSEVAPTPSGELYPPRQIDWQSRHSERSRCKGPLSGAAPINQFWKTARQLKSNAELESLLARGKAGTPQRIAIRVEGAFGAGCECPPFSAWFSEEDSLSKLLPIAQKNVVDIGLARPRLHAILIGYFSGATIDTIEYFQAMGQATPSPDDEQAYTWLEIHPEFCVEAWCYAIPNHKPDPDDGDAGIEYAKFLDEVSRENAADFAKIGAMKCKPEWIR